MVNKRQLPVETIEGIVQLAEKGCENDQIAKEMNVSVNTVTRYKRFFNLV